MPTPGQPVSRNIRVNGIKLCYFEWRAAPGNQEPPLVFAHATGFHARVWDAVIEHFPDRRVISLDLRGHGRSEGEPIDSWRTVSDDIIAFLDQLRIRRAVGIGHSMGAHTMLQAASERSDAFSQLVLFDPVILAPEFYAPTDPLFTPDAPHPAIRRKRDFASPDEMIERFKTRDPFNIFEPRVFDDYCRYGLLAKDSGGFELACLPEMEASVYASSRSNAAILETAKSVDIPVLVVRAKQTGANDFKSSPTWPKLAHLLPKGTDLHRNEATHFLPFEDSADAAGIIADAIAR